MTALDLIGGFFIGLALVAFFGAIIAVTVGDGE